MAFLHQCCLNEYHMARNREDIVLVIYNIIVMLSLYINISNKADTGEVKVKDKCNPILGCDVSIEYYIHVSDN